MTYLHDEKNNPNTEEDVFDDMDIFDEESFIILDSDKEKKLEDNEHIAIDDLMKEEDDTFSDKDSVSDDEDINENDSYDDECSNNTDETENDLFPDEDDDDDEEEEDLFMMNSPKRKANLPEGEGLARVGEIKVDKMPKGRFDKPWNRVTIPFEIKCPKTGEIVTVPFFANKSTGKNSRLYPIIKGILGYVPDDKFSLKDLIGKKVRVEIEHRQDDEKNVWENIVLVRPYRTKK